MYIYTTPIVLPKKEAMLARRIPAFKLRNAALQSGTVQRRGNHRILLCGVRGIPVGHQCLHWWHSNKMRSLGVTRLEGFVCVCLCGCVAGVWVSVQMKYESCMFLTCCRWKYWYEYLALWLLQLPNTEEANASGASFIERAVEVSALPWRFLYSTDHYCRMKQDSLNKHVCHRCFTTSGSGIGTACHCSHTWPLRNHPLHLHDEVSQGEARRGKNEMRGEHALSIFNYIRSCIF